jgi:hypothetical protein
VSASWFSVQLDTSAAVSAFEALGWKANIAVSRALNRTATSERAALSRAIASDMGLNVGTVKDAISIEQATAGRLSVRIVAKGKRIPLIDFKAKGPEPSRGRGRGVVAKLPGGRGQYAHAFIATMRSGHRGVFQRVPNGSRHGAAPNRSQLPIYELFGPSIVKVFEKQVPVGEARRTDLLLQNVQHELGFALSNQQTRSAA